MSKREDDDGVFNLLAWIDGDFDIGARLLL